MFWTWIVIGRTAKIFHNRQYGLLQLSGLHSIMPTARDNDMVAPLTGWRPMGDDEWETLSRWITGGKSNTLQDLRPFLPQVLHSHQHSTRLCWKQECISHLYTDKGTCFHTQHRCDRIFLSAGKQNCCILKHYIVMQANIGSGFWLPVNSSHSLSWAEADIGREQERF